MSLPLVTVVIPVFNAADWIEETLASVTAQTYRHDRLEVIVIDDGSSDGSGDRARAALAQSDLAYQLCRHASPKGPSAARNLGWQTARGDWIQFLDADDLLERAKVELQASAAAGAPGEVAALFSPWGRLTSVNDAWIHGDAIDPRLGSDPLADVLRAEHFMANCSLLFSRAWLTRVGGYVESYRLIEDVDLHMRLIMAGGRFERVSATAPVCWYRQRAESLSRENAGAFIEACLRNARCAERYWRERSELTLSRAAVLARIYFLGTRFYAEHDRAVFESLAADIHRLDPRFLPPFPASLRRLARVIGYPRAERSAVHYRRLKRVLRSASPSNS